MKILLHSCCGPCLGGSIDILRQNVGDMAIEAFWHNPNIHPYLEYRERMLSFIKICNDLGLKTGSSENSYGLQKFLLRLNNLYGEERCAECYRMRFEEAAKYSAQNGFSAFTSTLLVSPYQQHELIKEVGETVAKEYGTSFHYCDFRPGFRMTHESARKHELYRQKYCGCIFSEYDRYKGDKRFSLPEINS